MESYLFKFFGVLLATFLLIFAWFKRKYSYWKTLGVEYEEPTIPFGNLADGFRRNDSIGEWYASFYQRMKDRKLKHAGSYFFSKPLYVPLDLELIKRIMQTDFAHFTDHGGPMNEKDDPLTAHLFTLGGQKWRTLRVKLTPTFTSGKMKMMFPIMVKISEELGDTLNRECKNGEALIDIKDISARFTTDVIVNCAFGLECSSLKDPNAEFRIQGRRLSKLTLVETIVNFLAVQFPGVINFFGVRILPKEPADFFWNAIKETVEYRMKNDVRRNDALQLLMDMLGKEGENEENTLTFKELAAQAFLFYIAGYETSSTLISFVMVELSANQEIQDKLRHEIDEVLDQNNGELTYEAVHSMRYLDMVINGKFYRI